MQEDFKSKPRLLSDFETSLNYRETLYQKMGGGEWGSGSVGKELGACVQDLSLDPRQPCELGTVVPIL